MTFEEQLKTTGKLVYTNRGISMMPLLRENRDVMVIEACSGEQVQRLDAVLFTRNRSKSRNVVDMPCDEASLLNGQTDEYEISAVDREIAVTKGKSHAADRGTFYVDDKTDPARTKKDYVLHRVLRVNSDGTFWIIGDNCISGEIVRGEQIIGRLTAVIRDGQTISISDPKYRFYVNLWCRPYHLRIFILRVRSFIRRGFRYIRKHIRSCP
jgi:hypothetical protein